MKTLFLLQEKLGKKLLEGIDLAKTCWSRHLADIIHQMAKNSRDSWQAIKTLKEGILEHHKSPDIMCLKKKMVLSLKLMKKKLNII